MRPADPSLFKEYGFKVVDQPISRYSCVLCGGPADVLIRTENSAELERCVNLCYNDNISFRVFGGLSNVLIGESGFRGVAIINRGGSISCENDPANSSSVLIQADSGVMMSTLMSYCEQHGIGGLEWAAGLPGTLGGAVYGNAGASGSEIGQSVTAISLIAKGKKQRLTDLDGFFEYRRSGLKKGTNQGIILDVVLRAYHDQPELIREKMGATIQRRRSSQPHGCGSLGCTFKNPEGTSAGKLIDEAGLKGMRFGKAEVSKVHANFIVMRLGACADDYLGLLGMIKEKVFECTGVVLEPEIEIL